MRNKFIFRITKKQKINPNSAFTILFAVIVSTLVLALGLGIVAITMKEVQLSGAGRDSQLAFYAADSGSECALYYDTIGDFFATSSDSRPNQTITCNGKEINPGTETGATGEAATSTFQMCMEYSGDVCVSDKPCVDVVVAKKKNEQPAPNDIDTSIDARGYNTCNESHPRRLERGYRLDY